MFPGGTWELLGQSPTRNFSRLVPICKGGVGGLQEHLGRTRGAGEKGALKGAGVGWGDWGKEERGCQLVEVGKGSWGPGGPEEKPQFCSEDELRDWAGADRSLGPQPGGSSGQLAYRRSLVLVSRFESSLRPWPPSAPTSPLASVPWQHLCVGGSRNKGFCLPGCLSLWALPDFTVHTWAPTGPLPSGPLTNPRTTRLPIFSPTNVAPNNFPQGSFPGHFPKDPSHPSLLAP